MKTKKVKLELVGLDGNAFFLMGAFSRAARRQGWSQPEINAGFLRKASRMVTAEQKIVYKNQVGSEICSQNRDGSVYICSYVLSTAEEVNDLIEALQACLSAFPNAKV